MEVRWMPRGYSAAEYARNVQHTTSAVEQQFNNIVGGGWREEGEEGGGRGRKGEGLKRVAKSQQRIKERRKRPLMVQTGVRYHLCWYCQLGTFLSVAFKRSRGQMECLLFFIEMWPLLTAIWCCLKCYWNPPQLTIKLTALKLFPMLLKVYFNAT